MSFHGQRTVKARKRHRCCETGSIIEVGETYVKMVGMWDGDFYCEKMKAAVAPIFDRISRADEEGIAFGSLSDHIFDNLQENVSQARLHEAEEFIKHCIPEPKWMRDAINEARKELQNES